MNQSAALSLNRGHSEGLNAQADARVSAHGRRISIWSRKTLNNRDAGDQHRPALHEYSSSLMARTGLFYDWRQPCSQRFQTIAVTVVIALVPYGTCYALINNVAL